VGFRISAETKNKTGKQTEGKAMKKLLLFSLVAIGFAFVPAQRSDAQIYVGIPGIVGVGIGYPGYYYGYPRYYGYPYGYYGYYPYRSYYWYNGHRVYYRHHRHHYYRSY
jgi:hypothetical protein